MAQQDKIGSHKTAVFNHDNKTYVVYHETPVVIFDDTTITLSDGNWMTYTTKTRMNQTASEYNLNYHVYQNNYKWYVVVGDVTMPYYDGITISR